MKKMFSMKQILAGLACGLVLSCAHATVILNQTSQGNYVSSTLGGTSWTTFRGMMSATNSIASTSNFSNLAQLQTYSAIWVDQELGSALSAAEINNLFNYVSAGKKLVLVGENSSWSAWNTSIMAVTGGVFTLGCSSASGTPLVSNALTAGVASVVEICGSTITSTNSPTMLFSNNMAALYGVGAGQVLVLGDSNFLDNPYLNSGGNEVFAQNIVNWVGTPLAQQGGAAVPEPASLALLGLGMAGLAFSRRHTLRRS